MYGASTEQVWSKYDRSPCKDKVGKNDGTRQFILQNVSFQANGLKIQFNKSGKEKAKVEQKKITGKL